LFFPRLVRKFIKKKKKKNAMHDIKTVLTQAGFELEFVGQIK